MAEFALGWTKTVVEGTVITVQSAIEEEGKLKDKVQHDLEFIKAEFEMMQSFLHTTNRERAHNEVMRVWVRLLRDLAFDVEDWVEFVVHMDDKSAWWWRMLPPCLAPTQHLGLAAAEIKQLKARVEDVSHRNMRYIQSNPEPAAVVPAEPQPHPSAFHILRGVWEAAGKHYGMYNLRDLIAIEGSGEGLQVVSVWASGGEGDRLGTKTGIIREAYCDTSICQEFKSRAWVKLAHPFNLGEFLDSLVTQLCKSAHQVDATEDHLKMKPELTKRLMEDKCLIVVEDVSTVVEWDAIKVYLPDSTNGSRIVVSTHDIGMAFMCTGKPYLASELRRFPDGHSICAFFRKVRESPIDFDKLKEQIEGRGVISVWGSSGTTSIQIEKVYKNIMQKKEGPDGLEFETYGWVHVPDYWLDLRIISRQLYLDLSLYGLDLLYDDDNDDKRADDGKRRCKNIVEVVDGIEEADLIQRCCKFLCEKDCLVVIDGLRSKEDWNLLKATFLSKPIKGCIIVITNEEWVARHCVKDHGNVAKHCVDHKDKRNVDCKGRVPLHIKDDVEASTAKYIGYRGDVIFSTTRAKARSWIKTAQVTGSREVEDLGLFLTLQHPGVVSVWGISGVGKSYIVRTNYYHYMLHLPRLSKSISEWLSIENKFTAYSWVHVPHPFNLMEFTRRLLVDFYSEDLQTMEMVAVSIMQGQDLIEECCKLLRKHNYFIVIDGLQSTHNWDLIKNAFFPRHVYGCVVVITNESKVARHCQDSEARRVNVKSFQDDEAYNLFLKVVWNNKELSRDEKELSKRILSKCGGLPKIISAIGEYCKPSSARLKNINDDFMGSLESYEQGFHRLRGLFSWMRSYFDYACSDTLKPCIFYLSVFPVNKTIRQRRLLRRWIAEGYCRDKAFITVEEEGDMLLSELINLSIIQEQQTPRKNLQLNGFFREYIISRPMEENLVISLKGNCTVSSQRTGQHLTIRRSWDRDMIVFESIDFSRLRSLTVSGEWRPFFVSAKNNMRLLRVLDLENTSGVTDDDLEHIVNLLPRLKFLSLRGCREITCLPDSLGDLRQLQTFDIRYTAIVMLPVSIIKLDKLQYIDAGTTEPWDLRSEDRASTPARSSKAHHLVSGCLSSKYSRCRQVSTDGVKVPRGIGKLTALQTLGVVNVSGAGGKAISKDLKKLTQLRKLRVSGINSKNYQELFSAISGHAHLVSLSMRLDKDQKGDFCCLDDISKPPKSLKSLKLYGHVHQLPNWMKQLDRLSKIDLEMTILKQEDIYFYEQLPIQRSTIQLRISVKPIEINQLHFTQKKNSSYAFWGKPQVFRIDCTSRLEVTFGSDYLTSSVELLLIHCSTESSLWISGLEHLYDLKEVWLKGSYGHEFLEQLKQQLSNHRRKPVLKPEVPPLSS